jgi:hypothetical protein
MKKTNSTPALLTASVFGLLVVMMTSGATAPRSANNPPTPAAQTQLAKDMIGTWVHVGEPGAVSDIPAEGGRFKFRTGGHWVLVTADAKTGMVVESFGGTYTLKGNEYAETVDYGTEDDIAYIGKTYKFTVKVEGDTMTQIGVGNPWNEIWKRAK